MVNYDTESLETERESVNVATRTVDENEHRTWRRSPRLFKKYLNYLEMKPVFDCVSTLEKK